MFEALRGGPMALRRLRDEMDRVFGNVFEGGLHPDLSGLVSTGAFPAMNFWETENALMAEVEVPGLTLSDLEVDVVGNELTIRGERRDPETKESVYHRRERPAGTFSRTVRVPTDISAEKVEASLKDGVLTVTLPKAEAARPRKIAIKGF